MSPEETQAAATGAPPEGGAQPSPTDEASKTAEGEATSPSSSATTPSSSPSSETESTGASESPSTSSEEDEQPAPETPKAKTYILAAKADERMRDILQREEQASGKECVNSIGEATEVLVFNPDGKTPEELDEAIEAARAADKRIRYQFA